MKRLKAFIIHCKKLMRRHRFSMFNVEDNSEEWHILVSPAGIMAALTALVLLIFGIVLALVAYTPVTEYLPGYKTEASRSRENLMGAIMRLDSMERIMNDMLTYNENIAIVTGGGTPAVRTSVALDSVYRNKTLVPPSAEDSVLRAQMIAEVLFGSGDSEARTSVREKGDMSAPVDGIVVQRADVRNGVFGIRIAGASAAQVTAVADGTVIVSIWTPDKGYILEIQHPDGLVSVYKNMHQTLVATGQTVRADEVIGYTADEVAEDGGNQFEFELWSGGKAVDPESFILF